MVDFIYKVEEGELITISKNQTELSKIGRVWSLIEPEILGELKIFKRNYKK